MCPARASQQGSIEMFYVLLRRFDCLFEHTRWLKDTSLFLDQLKDISLIFDGKNLGKTGLKQTSTAGQAAHDLLSSELAQTASRTTTFVLDARPACTYTMDNLHRQRRFISFVYIGKMTSARELDIIDRIKVMKEQEESTRCYDYFKQGAETAAVNKADRKSMVSWCQRVGAAIRISSETVWIAISLCERYLSSGKGRSKEVLEDRYKYQLGEFGFRMQKFVPLLSTS